MLLGGCADPSRLTIGLAQYLQQSAQPSTSHGLPPRHGWVCTIGIGTLLYCAVLCCIAQQKDHCTSPVAHNAHAANVALKKEHHGAKPKGKGKRKGNGNRVRSKYSEDCDVRVTGLWVVSTNQCAVLDCMCSTPQPSSGVAASLDPHVPTLDEGD